MQKVEMLGSLWETTKNEVEIAKKITKEEMEIKNKKDLVMSKEQLKVSFNIVNNQKEQLQKMLKKAGISASVYFPFKIKTGLDGELEFTPKNIFKMKKDCVKAKKQLEKALDANKITKEEFDILSDNLDEMLKENGLDQDKENIEVTDEEIEEMANTFDKGVEENMDGLMASIGEEYFHELCKEYEDMDMEDRKYKLQELNSKINIKLGIAGKLGYSTDKNLTFENSFVKGGYMLSEKDISEKGLKEMAKNMMEKGMVRKVMTDKKANLTQEQRKAIYDKILQQKRIQERNKQMSNVKIRKYAA